MRVLKNLANEVHYWGRGSTAKEAKGLRDGSARLGGETQPACEDVGSEEPQADSAGEYVAERVPNSRRGYSLRTPPVSTEDARPPRLDRRYDHLDLTQSISGESLAGTLERVLPY